MSIKQIPIRLKFVAAVKQLSNGLAFAMCEATLPAGTIVKELETITVEIPGLEQSTTGDSPANQDNRRRAKEATITHAGLFQPGQTAHEV